MTEHTAVPGQPPPEMPATSYPPDAEPLPVATADPTDQQVDDARAAYAAYGQATGNRNFRGEPMPTWDGLGDTIQRAWINAAATVRHKVELEAAG